MGERADLVGEGGLSAASIVLEKDGEEKGLRKRGREKIKGEQRSPFLYLYLIDLSRIDQGAVGNQLASQQRGGDFPN